MADAVQIFISWSGPRGNQLAIAVRKYFRRMIQAIKPFFSGEDIPRGVPWTPEIYRSLASMDMGIICVTRESLSSEWLHFEAGALAKNEGSRVTPYLLDVAIEELSEPFSTLNVARVNQEDTLKLIVTLNSRLPEGVRLSDDEVRDSFDAWFPKFKAEVDQIPQSDAPPPQPAEPGEELKEIRHTLVGLQQMIARTVDGTRMMPIMDDLRRAEMNATIARAVSQAFQVELSRGGLRRELIEAAGNSLRAVRFGE